jgi:branched-subunit amino acid transport protein
VHDGKIDIALNNPYLYGLIAAIITAMLTNHTFKTIIVGLLIYAIAYVLV